jgi:hypothetical protein
VDAQGTKAREVFVADIENDGPVADTAAQDAAPAFSRRLFFFKTLLGAATIATTPTIARGAGAVGSCAVAARMQIPTMRRGVGAFASIAGAYV